MDDTLHYICVVTRGSSWRSSLPTSSMTPNSPTNNQFENDVRGQRLLMPDDDLDDEDYDIRALEALGLIRTERDATSEDVYDDGGDEGGGLAGAFGVKEGQSTLFLFPEWMTGQAAPNYTEDPMLLNFPSSNDTELLIMKPMVVNLGEF